MYCLILLQKVYIENFHVLSFLWTRWSKDLFQSSWFCDSMVWGRESKQLTGKTKRDLNLPHFQTQSSNKLLLRRAVLAYRRQEFQEHSFSKWLFDKWGCRKLWPSSVGMQVHWPCTLELLCNSKPKFLGIVIKYQEECAPFRFAESALKVLIHSSYR